MKSLLRRGSAAVATVLASMMLLVSPAAADAPGPTDYVSEIASVEPPTEAIELSMIGGDSFIDLRVAPGRTVDVIGYRGEPYLRFEADGTVLENQRSPSKYLNEERYGTDAGPAEADPDADPLWKHVAADGQFAWHDHRTHWMNTTKPPGAEPGDTILEDVIPLVVDGVEVRVTVTSVLQAPPGPTGALLGGILAAGGSLALFRRLVPGPPALWLGFGSAVVLCLGLWAYVSVPAETGPSMVLWAGPLVALVALAAAMSRREAFLGDGLMLLGGASLVLWGWQRSGALSAAVIPSNAPELLDRAAVSFALVGGVLGAVYGLVAVAKALSQPVETD